jgi:transposase
VYLLQAEAKRAEAEKALACYGAVRQDKEAVLLAFSAGQPDSLQTWQFVMGLLAIARAENKRVLVIIWDNASWHKSKDLRQWIRAYNQAAKAKHEPRLIVHRLPTKSPWLNPIEPCWLHAKRAVCEPNGELTASELRKRLCEHFETKPLFNTFKIDGL